MKITWSFADGTTSEVEVNEELGNYITASRREESSAARKHRRHCYSLDAIAYEGKEYGTGITPEDELEADAQNKRIHDALSHLARFVAELDSICRLLEKKRINYSLIKGGVKDRDEQITRFQNDPDVPIFIGQIATAGLGITLTAASTMVFYSLDYSMSNFEQCKARIHRAGQRMPCTYIYLAAAGTVDEKVLKALKSKANLAKALVDDYRYGNNPFM